VPLLDWSTGRGFFIGGQGGSGNRLFPLNKLPLGRFAENCGRGSPAFNTGGKGMDMIIKIAAGAALLLIVAITMALLNKSPRGKGGFPCSRTRE